MFLQYYRSVDIVFWFIQYWVWATFLFPKVNFCITHQKYFGIRHCINLKFRTLQVCWKCTEQNCIDCWKQVFHQLWQPNQHCMCCYSLSRTGPAKNTWLLMYHFWYLLSIVKFYRMQLKVSVSLFCPNPAVLGHFCEIPSLSWYDPVAQWSHDFVSWCFCSCVGPQVLNFCLFTLNIHRCVFCNTIAKSVILKSVEIPSLIPLAGGFRPGNTMVTFLLLVLDCPKISFHPFTNHISSN